MHRRVGRRASLRRIQHVGDGFQVRRARLSAAFPPGEDSVGESGRNEVSGVIVRQREKEQIPRCARNDKLLQGGGLGVTDYPGAAGSAGGFLWEPPRRGGGTSGGGAGSGGG